MPPDDATLADIVVAAPRIERFTHGVERGDFLTNAEKQSAVLHQLPLIGEAVRRLAPEFRDRHQTIVLRQWVGMRNILIHAYDRVDLDIVWDTVEHDIPRLLAYVAPLVPTDEG